MIIDTSTVQGELVKFISSQVGDRLSVLNNTVLPAVIQDIQGGVRPDFPFITVTLERDIDQTDGFFLAKYLTQDINEQHSLHIFTEQKLLFTIKCMGDGASDILKYLRMVNVDSILMNDLNEATNTKFQYYTDIDRTPTFLYTEFVNSASMDICLLALSEWVRTTDGVIEQVDGDSCYYYDPEDENPIIVPFSIDNSQP
jgi:hypothetical protein